MESEKLERIYMTIMFVALFVFILLVFAKIRSDMPTAMVTSLAAAP